VSGNDLSRLQYQIDRLLKVGVVASSSVLAVGLTLWIVGLPLAASVLAVGLVLLMGIPVARIGASFIDAVRQRDWLLIGSTAIVLLVMALTLVLSLATA
jgi:uncharacterized membrane protein